MANAISGAVIVGNHGSMTKYKRKCDKCGHTESNTFNHAISSGSNISTTFRCQKCGNMQKLLIQKPR